MPPGRFSGADKTRSQLLHLTTDLTSILQSLPLMVITVGGDGTVSHWNAAAEQLLGPTAATVVGKQLQDCAITWDWERMRPALRGQQQALPTQLDNVAFTRSDGSSGLLTLTVVWVPASSERQAHCVIVGTDRTAERQRDLQSVQSMKLEAIGQLAAGIAHEINTPVQYVGDNVNFLKGAIQAYRTIIYDHLALLDQLDQGVVTPEQRARSRQAIERADLDFFNEEAPNAIRSAMEGVDRIASIVRSLKEFAHPDPGHPQPVDLARSLENTLNVARNEYKLIADIVTHFDPALPPVQGFSGELNQVFLNLIVNAAHAIADQVERSGPDGPGRGTITITTSQDGEVAEIAISDTGTGIPPEIQSRIFDPFFTTKGVGKGTGQGLYLAREIIVKRHRGTITFTTERGKGTTFRIRLPYAPEGSAG